MMKGMALRGELEQRVMELLWAAVGPQSVSEVQAEVTKERTLAYTTVMTVLDRLTKKGMAKRRLIARSWHYEAANPQHEVVAREMLAQLNGVRPDVRRAALSEFQRLLEGNAKSA